jgi:hypothetical protein
MKYFLGNDGGGGGGGVEKIKFSPDNRPGRTRAGVEV